MIQRLLINTKTLTQTLKFTYVDEWEQHVIKPYNIKTPDAYKKEIRKNKRLRPFPKVRANFYDPLYMPGLDNQRLHSIQQQLLMKKQQQLSNQFVSFLMYNLSKNNIMLQQTMKIIQEWIPRHKGQYTSRQIFGCLYAAIIYKKTQYLQFFLDEIKSSNLEFQLAESLQIIQALNKSNIFTLEEKHKFWEKNFKASFVNNMHRVKKGNAAIVIRIFDAFKEFQYFDEQIWDQIIIMMDNKGGWIRTTLVEKLYPLTGTFEKAKMLFDKYYTKLSTNRNIQWRYNLEQLRMYSSEQMIAKSQQNIQMHPNFRTLLPKHKLNQITEKYDRWLVSGAVKQEEQIIRDKSASFGYAIKDRFESLTKDKVDFSKITKSEFEELFGQYDQATMKQKEQGAQKASKGEEQVSGEEPVQQEESK